HWEGEVDLLKENLEKFQNQLYSVTTNRQYDAITMQIENVNEKISEGDKNKKEFEKKEQELTEKTQQLQDKIEILEQNLQVKERELHEKIKSTEDEFQLYQQKRLELASQIKKPVLYQYERIRKVKGATTVVEINKYACGGCFSAIPPQKAVEVRHMNQLILCESCGRIMVYTNDKPMVAS
ncbi:MAG: zinc ribbon domain-containing protein, partial [Desulfobacterales bacterium]